MPAQRASFQRREDDVHPHAEEPRRECERVELRLEAVRLGVVDELAKPGRDPRDKFVAPKWRDDVKELADLKPGMALEGVVTNVTRFGAFVDIGVHQDGLVHISELSDRYVKDPNEAVKVGQTLDVAVKAIEPERRRISLVLAASADEVWEALRDVGNVHRLFPGVLVEAHLEGEEDEVRQLIERLGEGPPSAEVSKVDVEEVEPEDFHHFAVARSF